jgi:NitT/TauT family transport system ATP-binding protein
LALIELAGVTKAFNARGTITRALDPVDISVGEQEFVALLGPSGCGKSTVLNLIAGLLTPTAGTVAYRGEIVTGPNGRVGYMTQKDTLLPWRSVADNVGIALELRCRAVSAEERRERVAAVLELVGLTGFEKHFPAELSGGMRKRAALARMLVYEPETLLLDEPFGALDAQLKIVMHQELLRLTRLRGITVVFVTHDLSEAITLSDRILVFSGRPGRVRTTRTVPFTRERDVLKVQFEPAYASLYQDLWNELKPELETVGGLS